MPEKTDKKLTDAQPRYKYDLDPRIYATINLTTGPGIYN